MCVFTESVRVFTDRVLAAPVPCESVVFLTERVLLEYKESLLGANSESDDGSAGRALAAAADRASNT